MIDDSEQDQVCLDIQQNEDFVIGNVYECPVCGERIYRESYYTSDEWSDVIDKFRMYHECGDGQ